MNFHWTYICVLQVLTFLNTSALKLIPADRTVIKKNGSTHTISRYVLLPQGKGDVAREGAELPSDSGFSKFLKEFDIPASNQRKSDPKPKKKVDRYRIYIKRKLKKKGGKSVTTKQPIITQKPTSEATTTTKQVAIVSTEPRAVNWTTTGKSIVYTSIPSTTTDNAAESEKSRTFEPQTEVTTTQTEVTTIPPETDDFQDAVMTKHGREYSALFPQYFKIPSGQLHDDTVRRVSHPDYDVHIEESEESHIAYKASDEATEENIDALKWINNATRSSGESYDNADEKKLKEIALGKTLVSLSEAANASELSKPPGEIIQSKQSIITKELNQAHLDQLLEHLNEPFTTEPPAEVELNKYIEEHTEHSQNNAVIDNEKSIVKIAKEENNDAAFQKLLSTLHDKSEVITNKISNHSTDKLDKYGILYNNQVEIETESSESPELAFEEITHWHSSIEPEEHTHSSKSRTHTNNHISSAHNQVAIASDTQEYQKNALEQHFEKLREQGYVHHPLVAAEELLTSTNSFENHQDLKFNITEDPKETLRDFYEYKGRNALQNDAGAETLTSANTEQFVNAAFVSDRTTHKHDNIQSQINEYSGNTGIVSQEQLYKSADALPYLPHTKIREHYQQKGKTYSQSVDTETKHTNGNYQDQNSAVSNNGNFVIPIITSKSVNQYQSKEVNQDTNIDGEQQLISSHHVKHNLDPEFAKHHESKNSNQDTNIDGEQQMISSHHNINHNLGPGFAKYHESKNSDQDTSIDKEQQLLISTLNLGHNLDPEFAKYPESKKTNQGTSIDVEQQLISSLNLGHNLDAGFAKYPESKNSDQDTNIDEEKQLLISSHHVKHNLDPEFAKYPKSKNSDQDTSIDKEQQLISSLNLGHNLDPGFAKYHESENSDQDTNIDHREQQLISSLNVEHNLDPEFAKYPESEKTNQDTSIDVEQQSISSANIGSFIVPEFSKQYQSKETNEETKTSIDGEQQLISSLNIKPIIDSEFSKLFQSRVTSRDIKTSIDGEQQTISSVENHSFTAHNHDEQNSSEKDVNVWDNSAENVGSLIINPNIKPTDETESVSRINLQLFNSSEEKELREGSESKVGFNDEYTPNQANFGHSGNAYHFAGTPSQLDNGQLDNSQLNLANLCPECYKRLLTSLAQGQISSQTFEKITSQSSGQMSGQTSQISSQTSGQSYYPISGQSDGQISGQTVGQISGQTVGQISGQTVDQISGQPINQISGQAITQINGQPISQISGQAINQINGQPITQISGQAINQINGQPISQISGQTINQINGQPISQISGQTIKQINGQLISPINGQINQMSSQTSVHSTSPTLQQITNPGYLPILHNQNSGISQTQNQFQTQYSQNINNQYQQQTSHQQQVNGDHSNLMNILNVALDNNQGQITTQTVNIPNINMFHTDHLIKVLQVLENNKHSSKEIANLYQIIKLIYQVAYSENGGYWYNQANAFEGSPLKTYVYSLLQQSWLQELMVQLYNSNYNISAIRNPTWYAYLAAWRIPDQLSGIEYQYSYRPNYYQKVASNPDASYIFSLLKNYVNQVPYYLQGSVEYYTQQTGVLGRIAEYLQERGYPTSAIESLIRRLYTVLNANRRQLIEIARPQCYTRL